MTLVEEEIRPARLREGQAAAFARDVDRMRARVSEFVPARCPACDADDPLEALHRYSFRYVTCRRCDTLYMNPRPSRAVMAEYYARSENYAYWARHIFPASEGARRRKIHVPRFERVLALCRRFAIPLGTLLEVGAGFGTFCAVARDAGAFRRVVAVEPTPEMAAACRQRGVEVVQKRIEDITDEVRDVDVAVSFEVIEHLFEPRCFIEQCAERLRPGGLLVLTCPNGRGFDVQLLQSESSTIDPEHVNLFNLRSLPLLVERCGFEVLEVQTPGQLDAELVRRAVLDGRFGLEDRPFLQRVLIDEWGALGGALQKVLTERKLSSHMWMVARRVVSSGSA